MKNEICIIPPNKEIIVVSLICLVLSCVRLLLSDASPVLPVGLIVLSGITVCAECKTIRIYKQGICVQHHLLFLRRQIPRDRLCAVEYVCRYSDHYLLFSLDQCPSFSTSGQPLRSYIFLHPISLIAIRIPDKHEQKYLGQLQQAYDIQIDKTGDGFA